MSLTRHSKEVNWTPARAEATCGDLIAVLINLLPETKFERADSEGDDGLIYLTNRHGNPVKIKVSREALKDYLDANNHDQHRKEQQLARCVENIDSGDIREALISGQHLAP